MNKIKGVVLCPHCGKGKVVIYEGCKGQTSQGCPNCGGFFIVDSDTMKASASAKIKGASNMVVNN